MTKSDPPNKEEEQTSPPPTTDDAYVRQRRSRLDRILAAHDVQPIGDAIYDDTAKTTNTQANDLIARQYWLATPKMIYAWVPLGALAATMFWAVALIKTIGWGVDDYIMYFTNWSWSLQALFYAGDLICFIDRSRRMHFYFLSFMFWPVYLTVSAVFWIVLFVTVINDKLFRQAVNQYGVGDMIIGNTLVHVIPYFIIIVFLAIRSSDIAQTINSYREKNGRFGGLFFAYILANFVIALSYIVLYTILNDYTKVYFVKIVMSEAFLTVAITYVVVYFVTLIFLVPAARKLINYQSIPSLNTDAKTSNPNYDAANDYFVTL